MPKEDRVKTLPMQYPRSLAYPMLKANDTLVQAHSLTLDPDLFPPITKNKRKDKRYLSPGPTCHPGPGKEQKKFQPTTPTAKGYKTGHPTHTESLTHGPATFTPNPSK
jgi:hypothetical protein